ncbi:MAG: hypothetical protein ACT4NY_28215 [Pseudonocardiales bacterium]
MFDEQCLDHELRYALADEVQRLLASLAPELVLTCAAIGGHVDHLHTRAAVLDATDTELPILLWEDLPYGVRQAVPSGRPHRSWAPSPDSWARKWRALARYESQVHMLWPADTDWKSELFTHAVDRGRGRAIEMFLDSSQRLQRRRRRGP